MSIFDSIGDLLGLNKGKATVKAGKQNIGLIDQLAPVGQGYLEDNKQTTGDYLDLSKLGANAYADATGVNGADGSARATEAFRTSPGYEFSRDQGLQALERTGAKYGRADSGQTDLDMLKYGTGFADQEYQQWINNLSPYNSMYGAGVAGDTSANGSLTDWVSGITSAKLGANNQVASGKEAGQGALLDPLAALAGFAGKAFGYGGFGGSTAKLGTGVGGLGGGA